MVVSTNLRLSAVPQRFSAAAPEAPVKSGSWARTAGLTAMAAVAGIGALAATAQPAQADTRVGVTIGPNGVGVHVETYKNPWGHGRGGRGHGGHGHHGHQHCDNHGPFFTAVAKDGRVHRIDRFNHVNDHTGHYILRTNPWNGQLYRDYNVGDRCSW